MLGITIEKYLNVLYDLEAIDARSLRKSGPGTSELFYLLDDVKLEAKRTALCRNLVGKCGGASRDRTDDLIVANDALSQLSYSPTVWRDIQILAVVHRNLRLNHSGW
jgi:hypothetical protein